MTNPNTEHIDVETLSAFADGELKAVALSRVERHLADCASCRDALARIRALVASAAGLTPDIAPPPHAWAGIRDRVTRSASRVPARWWTSPWLAAAAAIVLVAGTAIVTRNITRGGESPGASLATSNAPTAAAVASVERQYAPTLAELRSVLDTQRGSLAPSTVRKLERSLGVIDSAIAEARSALAADPASPQLADMLAGYYQRKVDFLKRATTIASSL